MSQVERIDLGHVMLIMRLIMESVLAREREERKHDVQKYREAPEPLDEKTQSKPYSHWKDSFPRLM